MEMTGSQLIPAPRAKVWAALNDAEILRQCITGCDTLTKTSDTSFEAAVTVKLGPVKAKFKGKLQLENLQPPDSYTLRFDGQGGAAGHGKGTAEVKLESTGPRSTVLHYTAKATVGGKIAQLGSRLVDMAAQKMATEFFTTFNAKLQERYQVAPEPLPAGVPPAPQNLIAKLLAWLKRLFGG